MSEPSTAAAPPTGCSSLLLPDGSSAIAHRHLVPTSAKARGRSARPAAKFRREAGAPTSSSLDPYHTDSHRVLAEALRDRSRTRSRPDASPRKWKVRMPRERPRLRADCCARSPLLRPTPRHTPTSSTCGPPRPHARSLPALDPLRRVLHENQNHLPHRVVQSAGLPLRPREHPLRPVAPDGVSSTAANHRRSFLGRGGSDPSMPDCRPPGVAERIRARSEIPRSSARSRRESTASRAPRKEIPGSCGTTGGRRIGSPRPSSRRWRRSTARPPPGLAPDFRLAVVGLGVQGPAPAFESRPGANWPPDRALGVRESRREYLDLVARWRRRRLHVAARVLRRQRDGAIYLAALRAAPEARLSGDHRADSPFLYDDPSEIPRRVAEGDPHVAGSPRRDAGREDRENDLPRVVARWDEILDAALIRERGPAAARGGEHAAEFRIPRGWEIQRGEADPPRFLLDRPAVPPGLARSPSPPCLPQRQGAGAASGGDPCGPPRPGQGRGPGRHPEETPEALTPRSAAAAFTSTGIRPRGGRRAPQQLLRVRRGQAGRGAPRREVRPAPLDESEFAGLGAQTPPPWTWCSDARDRPEERLYRHDVRGGYAMAPPGPASLSGSPSSSASPWARSSRRHLRLVSL